MSPAQRIADGCEWSRRLLAAVRYGEARNPNNDNGPRAPGEDERP